MAAVAAHAIPQISEPSPMAAVSAMTERTTLWPQPLVRHAIRHALAAREQTRIPALHAAPTSLGPSPPTEPAIALTDITRTGVARVPLVHLVVRLARTQPLALLAMERSSGTRAGLPASATIGISMMAETSFAKLACISVSHAPARLRARVAIHLGIPLIWLPAPA